MDNFMERLITLEIVERVCRMYRYLGHDVGASARVNPEPVSTFVLALDSLMGSLDLLLRSVSGTRLNEWEKLSVYRRLGDTFNAVDELHAQLQFLQGGWVRGEAYIFLRRILSYLPELRYADSLSIVLSNRYSFEEGDLAEHFQIILRGVSHETGFANRSTPAVFLPKIERDNPLNWGILAHECGHVDSDRILTALDDKGVIPRSASDDDRDTLRKWGEEFFCDLFATKILGPAYLACFSTFALVAAGTGTTESWSETHPSDFVRISVIKEVLDRANLSVGLGQTLCQQADLGSLYEFLIYERAKLDRLHIGRGEAAPLEIELEDFVDVIGDVVDEVLDLRQDGDPLRFDRVPNLADRLQKGIPIGSYATYGEEEKKRLLEEYASKSGANHLEGGFRASIKEAPTSISEILNAGWLHKVQNVFPLLANILIENEGSMVDRIREVSDELARLDSLLIKSIEVSELHRMLAR
jgi:hypothetical protein